MASPLLHLKLPLPRSEPVALPFEPHHSTQWGSHDCWDDLLRGHLVELSSDVSVGGAISLAAGWVAATQQKDEPVVWIQQEGGKLYPPDLAACGVCLSSLVIVHARRNDAQGMLQAVEILVRTGGVGLVVIDATDLHTLPASLGWQGRLAAIAREQRSGILFITRKSKAESSLGPLIALHIRADYDLTAWPLLRQSHVATPTAHISHSIKIRTEASKNKLGLTVTPHIWTREVPQNWPCLL